MARAVNSSITSPRAMRSAAWAGLGLLVLTRLVLALVPMSEATEMVVSGVLTYLLPMLLGVIGGVVLGVRLRRRIERQFWGILAFSFALVLVVESHWTWYSATIDFHGPPLTAPIRALYVVAGSLYIVLILMMTRFSERSIASKLRFYVDLSAVIVVLFSVMYLARGLPFNRGSAPSLAYAVQYALYETLGLTILGAIAAAAVGWKRYRWRAWERLVVVALGGYGIGLIIFPFWYEAWLRSTEAEAGWIGLILGCAVYLLVVAGVYRVTAADVEALDEPWPMPEFGSAGGWRALPVVIAALLPPLGWYAIMLQDTADGLPLVVAVAVLAVLLVARSWLTALEIAHHRLSAVTDDLTGAYNERYLNSRLDELIGGRGAYEFSLVLFEIADYGRVVEVFGREWAEHSLRHVADNMVARSPSGADVFRLGGGAQLAALLPETTIEATTRFAAAVTVGATRGLSGQRMPMVSLFAGIACFPVHALDPEGLLMCARIALESARQGDEGHVGVYSPATDGDRTSDTRVDIRALRETVRALAAAVDARDPATRNHSAQCAELATSLARRIGMTEESVQLIGLAALMHDVGKIGVPDSILLKPGPLDPEERLAVQEHCDLGVRILAPANLGDIMPLVRHHHERWDGAGYPDGLAGEEIPLEARVMAVCDTYETLTAGRPYQDVVGMRQALDEIQACAGTQFDPVVAREFGAMLDPHLDAERQRSPSPLPDLATGDASP